MKRPARRYDQSEVIKELKREIRKLKLLTQWQVVQRNGALSKERKHHAAKRKEVRAQYKWLEGTVSRIVKDESWDSGTSKHTHLEIIIRTIVSYTKLTSDGILVYSEFAFLLVGSQYEFFSRRDIRARFGFMHFFHRDVKACIDAGYLKKVEYKKLYYITLDGRARLDAILGYIYREKGLGWPVRDTTK